MSEKIKHNEISELFSKDCLCFWLGLIIGVTIAIIGGVFFLPLYGDSISYAMSTRLMAIGENTQLVYSNPPLLPYLGGLISKIGFEPHAACYMAGSGFYVLSIIPLYYVLRHFFDTKFSSIGCLIYMVCPEIIMSCCIGMLESGFLFFLLSSLGILFGFFKEKKVASLLMLGVSLGLLFFARNESFIFVLFVLFYFVIMNLRKYKYKPGMLFIKSTLLYLACILIPLAVVVAPRCFQVYKETGYFAATSRQGEHILKLSDIRK